MSDRIREWTTWVPLLAAIVLAALWGSHPSDLALLALMPLLAGAVYAAVQHAEVVAHRIGLFAASLACRAATKHITGATP